MTETIEVLKAARELAARAVPAMCMTWDHSYEMMPEQERLALAGSMAQVALWDVSRVIAEAVVAERERCAAASELLEVLKALVDETVEYAAINNLGDAEKQHNIKWARSVIAKATGGAA